MAERISESEIVSCFNQRGLFPHLFHASSVPLGSVQLFCFFQPTPTVGRPRWCDISINDDSDSQLRYVSFSSDDSFNVSICGCVNSQW